MWVLYVLQIAGSGLLTLQTGGLAVPLGNIAIEYGGITTASTISVTGAGASVVGGATVRRQRFAPLRTLAWLQCVKVVFCVHFAPHS